MNTKYNPQDQSDSRQKDAYVQQRSIFRAEAQQQYVANQEKVIFPRLLSKNIFTALWITAILLFILGIIIVFWPLIEPFIRG